MQIMKGLFSPWRYRVLLVITILAAFVTDVSAQKNADGTYTLRKPDGSLLTYYPARPGNKDRSIDSLAVEGLDGAVEMFYRVEENPLNGHLQSAAQQVFQGEDNLKTTNEDGTVTAYYTTYPECDCDIDTLEVEMPDGSLKRYYTIRDGNKNILRKDTIVDAASKMIPVDVYENAEVMPKFKSGRNDLTAYVKKNIRFKNNGKRYVGALNIHFIVLKNGKIEKMKFDRDYSPLPPALEKDLRRILKGMPSWKPGKVNGVPVNVYYTLQVNLVI